MDVARVRKYVAAAMKSEWEETRKAVLSQILLIRPDDNVIRRLAVRFSSEEFLLCPKRMKRIRRKNPIKLALLSEKD